MVQIDRVGTHVIGIANRRATMGIIGMYVFVRMFYKADDCPHVFVSRNLAALK